MIGAMARAGARLAEPRYLAAAERAAGFVLVAARGRGGRHAPPRLPRGPRPRGRASSTTTPSSWRACSSCTGRRARSAGWARRCDSPRSRSGGSATRRAAATSRRRADPRLLFRAKPAFDGAVASGNGIAALNAVELSAPHRRPRVGRPRRGDAPGLRRRDGAGPARTRHARARARALAARRPARKASAAAPAKAVPPAAPSAADDLEEEAYEAASSRRPPRLERRRRLEAVPRGDRRSARAGT